MSTRALSIACLLVVASAAACSSSTEHATPLEGLAGGAGGGGGSGGGGGEDAGGGDAKAADAAGGEDVAPDAGGAPRIALGATSGSISLPFSFGVHGTGGGFVSAFDLTANSGTVTLAGEKLPAIVYEQQPFGGTLVLYQTLIVAPDRWYVVWFYCDAGKLIYDYYESTDGTPVTGESLSGTCVEAATDTMTTATFPAIDMPPPAVMAGYAVTGTDLDLPAGAPGHANIGGTAMTVFPFNDVDCSTTCGSPGWRELHALLWDEKAARACFTIFYLFDPPSTKVTMSYSLTLPTISDPPGDMNFVATWSQP